MRFVNSATHSTSLPETAAGSVFSKRLLPLAIYSLSAFALLAFPGQAFALCANPAGAEGEIVYNDTYNVVQFCDGTSWISMTGAIATSNDARIGSIVNDKWCGADSSGIINCTLTPPASTSSGSVGYIQFSNAGGAFADSGVTAGQQLFWDNTNKRLGIGTATPVAKLDVNGGVRIGDQTTCTDGTHNGTLRYNSGALEICGTTGWVAVGTGASGSGNYFTAQATAGQSLANGGFQTLTFGTEVDPGNAFNAATGVFTVPEDGFYTFSTSANLTAVSNSGVRVYASTGAWICYQFTQTSGYNSSCTGGRYLTAGTTVTADAIQQSGGSTTTTPTQTVFSGFRLGGGSSGSGSSTLAALTDVSTTGIANGKALVYNSTSSKWEPQTIVGGGGASPAFFVYRTSVQTVASNTWTPVAWTTETFDTSNDFASNKFTPTVAGRYQINLNVNCSDATGFCSVMIAKNASDCNSGYVAQGFNDTAGSRLASVSSVVDMNGSSDYVQACVYNNGGTSAAGTVSYTGNFSGGLLGGGGGTVSGTTGKLAKFTSSTAIGCSVLTESSGNVGIGTTSPASLLQVAGGVQLGDDTATCPGASNVKVGTLRFNGGALQLCTTGGWGSLAGASGGNTMFSGFPDALICTYSDSNKHIFTMEAFVTSFNGPVYMQQAGARYFAYNANGTMNASQSGSYASYADCNGKTSSQLTADGQAFNFVGGGTAAASGAAGQVQFYSGGNLAADSGLTWDNTNKRLGIGTMSPGAKLHVNGGVRVEGGNPAFQIYSGSTERMHLATDGSLLQLNTGATNSDIAFVNDGGAHRITIKTSTGNVGIGTTSPGYRLHVSGSGCCSSAVMAIQSTGGGGGTWAFHSTDSSYGEGANHLLIANAGAKFNLDPAGNLAIAGSLSQNSDIRLKTDIRDLKETYGLEAISKLKPVIFKWRDRRDTSRQIGFIAQDVRDVLPELVRNSGTRSDEAPDGALTLNYQGIIPPLVKAIQELKADNDNLRAQLKAANDNNAAAIEDLRREIKALRADR